MKGIPCFVLAILMEKDTPSFHDYQSYITLVSLFDWRIMLKKQYYNASQNHMTSTTRFNWFVIKKEAILEFARAIFE